MFDNVYYEWYKKQPFLKRLLWKINKGKNKRHSFVMDQIIFKPDYLKSNNAKRVKKILEIYK